MTTTRPRNIGLERELTGIAAKGAGFTHPITGDPDDGGITEWAEFRALPGGVRLGLDDIRETREELADARNYLVWGVERVYDRYLAGDPEVIDAVVKRMDALTGVVRVWQTLR